LADASWNDQAVVSQHLIEGQHLNEEQHLNEGSNEISGEWVGLEQKPDSSADSPFCWLPVLLASRFAGFPFCWLPIR
jgi:hypothetical protein